LRVPTLIASPYVPKGVVHSSPLQHTSVLATVRRLFGMTGSLTKRDAAAPSFEDLFLMTARSDSPTELVAATAKVQPALDATQLAPDDFMAEIARGWRQTTGDLPFAVPTSVPTSQDEIHQYLKHTINAFLDYRARSAQRSVRPKSR
jgi:hypothetical protein